uniref:NADH-ubiquinone oxidoreductase chain 2 n=1 Tax=Viviparus chui TaxID=2023714 RepID=A0A343FMQ7_9CAEN|nr:NADH dehydrogenase subunit 2 [Viviparus chui]ASR74837.1 NADH dehydrogenase subunit 2 [Viviparus chui]
MLSNLPFSYLFFFMMVFGTVFSMSSMHWLGIWVGLEMNLIGFLPILVYQKGMLNSEAAVKYLIVQAIGSSFLVFGSLIMYNVSSSWEILSLMSFKYFFVSVLFIIGSLLMKMGVFPFHFWFPSVMGSLPWLSCLLLVTWQKLAPVFLVGVMMEISNMLWLIVLVCVMSYGSAMVGGIGGMNQSQVRGLLAYSSIGHMGWIVFAVCHSYHSMKVYFFIYIIISLCLFFVLWYLDSSLMVNLNSSVKGLFVDLSVIVLLLSLGGLPPLLGFIGKWNVFMSIMNSSMSVFVFFLILSSVMSLFYYLGLFFTFVLKVFSSTNDELFGGFSFAKLILLVNFFGGWFMIVFDVFEFI